MGLYYAMGDPGSSPGMTFSLATGRAVAWAIDPVSVIIGVPAAHIADPKETPIGDKETPIGDKETPIGDTIDFHKPECIPLLRGGSGVCFPELEEICLPGGEFVRWDAFRGLRRANHLNHSSERVRP